MPRVKARASPRLHVDTVYGHTQRTDLKWQKKVIYPLVKDAQDCKKDVSNGYQYENSKDLKQDELQCKTKEANTLRTELSS